MAVGCEELLSGGIFVRHGMIEHEACEIQPRAFLQDFIGETITFSLKPSLYLVIDSHHILSQPLAFFAVFPLLSGSGRRAGSSICFMPFMLRWFNSQDDIAEPHLVAESMAILRCIRQNSMLNGLVGDRPEDAEISVGAPVRLVRDLHDDNGAVASLHGCCAS
jgi:hypothetical protein